MSAQVRAVLLGVHVSPRQVSLRWLGNILVGLQLEQLSELDVQRLLAVYHIDRDVDVHDVAVAINLIKHFGPVSKPLFADLDFFAVEDLLVALRGVPVEPIAELLGPGPNGEPITVSLAQNKYHALISEGNSASVCEGLFWLHCFYDTPFSLTLVADLNDDELNNLSWYLSCYIYSLGSANEVRRSHGIDLFVQICVLTFQRFHQNGQVPHVLVLHRGHPEYEKIRRPFTEEEWERLSPFVKE